MGEPRQGAAPMNAANLNQVADCVIRRAQRQGYVLAREVREEMTRAGQDEQRWKEVVRLAGDALRYRGGRYHYSAPVTERVRAKQTQQHLIFQSVRELVQRQREAASRQERRGEDRLDFVQTVRVVAEDGRLLTLLTRDVSATGIRLVGTHRLLGQKV